MKKINLLLCSAIVCTSILTQTQAHTGAYVGFDAGLGGMVSNLNNSGIHGELNQSGSIQADGGTLGVHAGYTFLSKGPLQIGVEGGYQGYANNTLTRTLTNDNASETLTYSGHYVNLLAVARLELTPKWGIIAKAGKAHVSQSTSFGGNLSVDNDKDLAGSSQGYLPDVEFGSTYRFNDNHQLTIMATVVESNNEPTKFPSPSATREGINRLASIGMIKAVYEAKI